MFIIKVDGQSVFFLRSWKQVPFVTHEKILKPAASMRAAFACVGNACLLDRGHASFPVYMFG